MNDCHLVSYRDAGFNPIASRTKSHAIAVADRRKPSKRQPTNKENNISLQKGKTQETKIDKKVEDLPKQINTSVPVPVEKKKRGRPPKRK